MKNNLKIIIAIIILVIIGVVLYFVSTVKAPEESIIGCYVGHLANDVYSLRVTKDNAGVIEGTLDINNAEKDSSTGTIKGTYKDSILLADYTFLSEGTTSLMQVVFKKVDDGFVRGYGKPDDATGTRFVDLSKITYDTSTVYKTTTGQCPTVQQNISLVDGRQCYAYNHEATTVEPYTVNEFLDININAGKVTGTKTGSQKGPDMTNGYTGTITGTIANNIITDIFSYTIEGSKNKEHEIYRAGKTGIEKMRYPLIEKNGALVPDTIKEFTILSYGRVGCTPSN